eukprot:TRINITY_DN860_c0_g1_i1.p1 TRINITY_DN860_c0_g1~~TRINITY_DN860_c0_g1_i1.p1  ORF type:complete len:340 (-),score=104.01 TRINITY_DN860_c0_g1_i1:304-1323(-)
MRLSVQFYVLLLPLLYYFELLWGLLLVLPVAIALSYGLHFLQTKFAVSAPNPTDAVLVTGTSTGFGRMLALELAARGVTVFATVRKEADADSLKQSANNVDNLLTVLMDVCNDSQIAGAATYVREKLAERNQKLYGIVNNAGLAIFGPIEEISREKFARQLDINVCGLNAVTAAFAPLLRERGKGGRIINISSLVGMMTTPFSGAYCASKHAVEAVSDAMRLEMAGQGIMVSCVEPGGFSTNFNATGSVSLQDPSIGDTDSPYAAAVKAMRTFQANLDSKLPPPDPVVHATIFCLYAWLPPARVLVGIDANVVGPLMSFFVPDQVLWLGMKAAGMALGW